MPDSFYVYHACYILKCVCPNISIYYVNMLMDLGLHLTSWTWCYYLLQRRWWFFCHFGWFFRCRLMFYLGAIWFGSWSWIILWHLLSLSPPPPLSLSLCVCVSVLACLMNYEFVWSLHTCAHHMKIMNLLDLHCQYLLIIICWTCIRYSTTIC